MPKFANNVNIVCLGITVHKLFDHLVLRISCKWLYKYTLSHNTKQPYHASHNRRPGRTGFDPRRGQRIFPLSSVSRPALGPTQPPVQWVPGVLSPGVKCGRGVTLTTHLHLVPRSWMSRSCTSSLRPSASMACNGTALLTLLLWSNGSIAPLFLGLCTSWR
jgi:hypothetical protein